MNTILRILTVVALFATCTYCHKDIDVSFLIQKILALEKSVEVQNARINGLEKSNKELKNLLIEKTVRIEYVEAIMLQQHKEAKQFVTEEVSKENNYTNRAIKYTENTNRKMLTKTSLIAKVFPFSPRFCKNSSVNVQ